MWKRVSYFIVMALVSSVLLSGCSQSDDKSATSDWKPSQEVIVINGHTLPPEPNPAINNSTLFGVDSNDNEVRDDVEIWIYKKYKDKHPIHIDIAMQAGRAWQKVLEDPTRAKEIHSFVSASSSCEAYYEVCIKSDNKQYISEWINTKYFRKKIYFNTPARLEAYNVYDTLLSGGVYTIPRCSEKQQLCDFNTSKYESDND